VPGPDISLLLALSPTPFANSGGDSLFAYGSLPGMELIPYFLALLAWVGMALAAIFLAPFTALLRRLRSSRNPPAPKQETEATASIIPESPGEDRDAQT
jgi:hypothetical protein